LTTTRQQSKAALASGGPRRADGLSGAEQWLINGLLLLNSLAYNYNFLIVDYVRPFLVSHLHWTLRDTALLYAFQGTGVIVGSVLSAWLVARTSSRAVLLGSALAITGFTAIGLWVPDQSTWMALRFGVGIALSASYVSATTMLANFFPPRVRGRLLSANAAMFSIALILLGVLGATLGEAGWRGLIWIGAAAPFVVFLFTAFLLPNDRDFSVYADQETSSDPNTEVGSWREMLQGSRLKITLACLLLAGLNFSGYQFYSGFITTYLQTVRHFDANLTGVFVTADGIGALIGSFVWGWAADRVGRRFNAIGFVLAAAFIVLYLLAPPQKLLLYGLELGYAISLACTYCWGAYFAELFPVRLRPMGSSLFHGGHIISLTAPLIVTVVAEKQSLVLGMAMAPLTFVAAAVVWWLLPETLHSSRSYKGFKP
jgi:MFS family permease